MTRTGWAIAALFVLAAIGLASLVRVTGPGRHPVQLDRPARPTGVPRLAMPVSGVAPSSLTDSFDDPRGAGTRRHHAIDVMAPLGTPVVAAVPGRIEKLFTSAEGGLTVYQRVAPDVVLYYAHLDRYAPALAEGQMVAAGQVLGAVGTSGDADPGASHLHFEVHAMGPGERWWQGTEIDPYPLLRGRG